MSAKLFMGLLLFFCSFLKVQARVLALQEVHSKRQFLGNLVCYKGSLQEAKTDLEQFYAYVELVNPTIIKSGLSPFIEILPGILLSVYLTEKDLQKALILLDDELDLNFDHYNALDYLKLSIGKVIFIGPCASQYFSI